MRIFSILLSIACLLGASIAQDYTCSPNKPCAIGCCGINNVCGLGPAYCAPGNCTSSCEQKSDCDPGWGPQWSSAEKCPLNVCCSKFGFCGTTSEFCGDAQVQSPSCSGQSSNQRTVGYYEAWATTRPCDAMYPEEIPAGAYTHLNFAFAFIDPNTYAVAPMDAGDNDLYTRFTGLKATNPGLQTWISIGGWSANDPDQPTHSTFSDLAGSTSAQGQFFNSLISFLTTYHFDGVDIDWEYPVAPERSGKPVDYANYVSFLSNLKSALAGSGHNYGLSITIPSSYWYMQHFDIVGIANVVDWLNIMSYDLHGTWDGTDPYIGAVVNAHTNLTEIDQTLDLLWRNNIDTSKVTLGLGFYGRSFTLSDPSCTSAGTCRFSSGGNPGECTQSSGTLSYAEISRLVSSGASVTLDKAAAVKIVTYGGNQWVSYDDQETLKMKVDYANSKCLGGTMVWAVSTDTLQGDAAAALSASTGRLAQNLQLSTSGPQSIAQCFWGDCGADCPAGTTPAQRSDGKNKGNVGLWNGCAFHNKQRNYCCPPNNVPTCQWRGTAPFCNGKCESGEVQVTTDNAGTGASCATGHKALCCASTASDSAIGLCQWVGKAPSCAPKGKAASCPSGLTQLTQDSFGSGGDAGCYTGAKSFCCPTPSPYQNCDWYSHGDKIIGAVPGVCGTPQDCPSGKYPVASDPSGCQFGTARYYCCDAPGSTPQLNEYKDLLNTFLNDPHCTHGQRTQSKRSTYLSGDQMLQLSTINAQLFQSRTQSQLQTQQRQAFDDILGPHLNAYTGDFQQLYINMPGIDPLWIAEEFACLGQNAGAAMLAYNQTTRSACILPSVIVPDAPNPTFTVPNSAPPRDDLKRRNLDDNLSDTTAAFQGQNPPVGYMLQELANGQFTYMYSRYFPYNGRQQNEGEIEVAFLMGNDPTNIDPTYQGNQNNPQDVYFVLHFHVGVNFHQDPNRAANSPSYVGVYAMNVFHAQNLRRGGQGGNQNTVANDNNNNRRTRSLVFDCDMGVTGHEMWYIGAPVHLDPRLNALSQYLATNNYVNTALLENVVFPEQTGYYDYMNWEGTSPQGPMTWQNGQWVPWQPPANYP